MYLEQIQSITTWDYCKVTRVEDDEDLYQFGFKEGIHFYLSEYFFEDSLGKWLISAWKNKMHIISIPLKEFEEVLIEINKILDDNRTETI